MMIDYTFKVEDGEIHDDLGIREFFEQMINGSDVENGRGQYVIWQNVLRDKDGIPVKHTDSYLITGEGRYRNRVPNMTVSGYFCKEFLLKAIYNPPTLARVRGEQSPMEMIAADMETLYVSYQYKVQENDVIIFPKLNDDGTLQQPIAIEEERMITKVFPRRSDNGRIEYYKCILERQK